MEKPFFKVKKLKEEAIIPSKRQEDAAYDLYAIFDEDFKILMPGEIYMAPTGLSIEIPQDWVFYIAERGSTGSKGISRRCGVVDSGYRGEIFVPLNNTSNKPVIFAIKEGPFLADFLEEKGLQGTDVVVYPQSKAIAQGMIMYVPHVDVEEVQELGESDRGDGALGSSGK